MNELLIGRLVLSPCNCPKLQGPSGNEVVVFGIDENGLGVMRGWFVGPFGSIHVMNCNFYWVFFWNVLGVLLTGMYEVEATIQEVEGTIMLNAMDVSCEVVAEAMMEVITYVGCVMVGC